MPDYGQVITPSVGPPPPLLTLQDLVPAEMLAFSISTEYDPTAPALALKVLPLLKTKL
jgi:hypothetical protein